MRLRRHCRRWPHWMGARSDLVARERIAAIGALRDAWSPGYRQAETEHRRLGYRIEHAEGAAGRYFRTQSELTGRIKDPEERSRAKALDRAEMGVYARWRDQAHRTRAQADRVMNDLHDLDIRITKELLSASFASVHRDFLELPIAVRRPAPGPGAVSHPLGGDRRRLGRELIPHRAPTHQTRRKTDYDRGGNHPP